MLAKWHLTKWLLAKCAISYVFDDSSFRVFRSKVEQVEERLRVLADDRCLLQVRQKNKQQLWRLDPGFNQPVLKVDAGIIKWPKKQEKKR